MPDKLSELVSHVVANWSDNPDAGPDDPWDSITKIQILIESEKEFGVRFGTEEIPDIKDLATLRAAIEKKQPRKKVLVLDCDGVLWRGVIGEGSEALTDKHVELQQQFIALERKGVLIALCSKNNPEDVHAAIKGGWFVLDGDGMPIEHMPLQSEHIVAEEISWDSKVDGLKRLAAKLNLGLDSFVFVDDSPVERGEVAERLPEVTVVAPDIPLAQFFANLPGKSLTDQYRLRQTVETAMDEATDRQAFLDSLDMRAVMRVNDESLAPRIAELSQKTNQFNMTLRRFTEDEIRERIKTGFVFCASLKDRFGDAGWVAMAVFVHPEDWKSDDVLLEDFCISCRVLGRGFERAFIDSCLFEIADWGWTPKFKYVPGPKNQQCANFFDGQQVAENVPRAPVQWEER